MKQLPPPATLLLGFILFVAPLKFGNSASTIVFSHFPVDLFDVLLAPWPVSWVPVLAGLALLLVLISTPLPDREYWGATWPVWLPMTLMLLTCGLGLIRPVNYFRAISFTLHMAGAVAFMYALLIYLHRHPEAKRPLFSCLFLGMILLFLQVIYQYFWGYRDNLAILQYQAEHGKQIIDSGIINRLKQNRPQAYFAIPNSLAAHLVLVCPLLLPVIWRWARNVDPPEVAKPMLTGMIAFTSVFCLYTTKSRAAMLALLLAILAIGLLAIIAYPELRKKYRKQLLLSATLLPILAIAGYLVIRDGRSISSLGARLVYWQGAWEMFVKQPLTGMGLGEFFPHFVKIKPPGAETARLPHSIFFHSLSTCGALGAAAATLLMISPLLAWRQAIRNRLNMESPMLFYAALLGSTAWLLHSAADLNIHVPATVLAFSAVLILSLGSPVNQQSATRTAPFPAKLALFLLAILAMASIMKAPGEYRLALLEDKMHDRSLPVDTLVADVRATGKLMPTSLLPWIRLGNRAYHEGRPDVMETAFREVVRIDPEYAAGHYRLATALFARRRLGEAEKELRIALEGSPHQAEYTSLWQELQQAKAQQKKQLDNR